MSMTVGLHLYFKADRKGQGKGIVSSFRLDPENQGVGFPLGWSLRTRWL
jgi:hypothetical protein